tara:strand:- start:1218 stop:1922 length:705 start_codon:yes stop_codon:yes gene_type:complete
LSQNFSIIIPIYNEADNISTLIEEIFKNLPSSNFFYEIIIVNDCSTDNSLKILKKFLDKKLIKVINNKINMGQSFSIYEGIKNSNNNVIVTLDGDGQNNPKDIKKMLFEYFKHFDVKLVSGIRKKRKDSFIKIISSRIANYFRNLVLNDGCPDTGCSLKIFDKSKFLQIPFFNGIHRFIPALFKSLDCKMIFIDVDHRYRVMGQSKYGITNRLFRGIFDLFKVIQIMRKLKSYD